MSDFTGRICNVCGKRQESPPSPRIGGSPPFVGWFRHVGLMRDKDISARCHSVIKDTCSVPCLVAWSESLEREADASTAEERQAHAEADQCAS